MFWSQAFIERFHDRSNRETMAWNCSFGGVLHLLMWFFVKMDYGLDKARVISMARQSSVVAISVFSLPRRRRIPSLPAGGAWRRPHNRGRYKGGNKSGSKPIREALVLDDHEIVLTFDDGPSAQTTPRIFDALAAECVKANSFSSAAMPRPCPPWSSAKSRRDIPLPIIRFRIQPEPCAK